MRILQVSSAGTMGGGERHLADLANELARRGHEVFAALPARSPLREELRALPAENIFTTRLRNALDLGSAVELKRLVREHRIEVVHAHLARDYPLAAFATGRRAKLVLTRHVLFRLSRLHAVTLRRAARVIAVSGAVGRALAAQKIFPASKIRVVQNGVDLRRLHDSLRQSGRDFFRRRLNVPAGCGLVGVVGDIKRQKGHEDFLRAAARVARERPGAHFIIAGGDSTRTGERAESLRRLACELGLANRAHFTGWLEETGQMLAALDVYVSASHTESFGLSIVEAMAAGLAVVATATEGAREVVGDGGDAGVIVPVGDAEAIAAAVLRLLDDPDARERLGRNARKRARTLFSLERMVDATEEVYKEVVSSQ